MLQTVSRLLPELPLILMTAVATHLVMSFAQTLMHYKLGHNPIGGKFFRNHINFHHAHYSKDHLVSRTYLGDEGNNTPFFFIPVFLVGACTYLVLPVDLFVAQLVACAASFYAHVFFDKEYHIEGSRRPRQGEGQAAPPRDPGAGGRDRARDRRVPQDRAHGAEGRARGAPGQEGDGGGEPAPRHLHRQEIHQPRPAVPRPDPGRQYRPDEGGRQIRVSPRLQVLDLR